MNVLILNSDVNLKRFTKQILKNESKIKQKYPPTNRNNVKTDGGTGLGYDSLTSRFYHFNILNWLNTKQLKKEIRKGYESYTNVKNTPLYVQCWANVMRKGDKIKPHAHMDENINPLHALSGHLCVKVDGSTNTYYGGKPVCNVNGEMTFFPSTMAHWTNTYLGDNERITVAFDIYSEEWFNYDVFEDAKKHYIKI
jgi:hypothetical protein|tara:strand:+ start:177 stop:764 length:588 start_codon:yes stop_codon:yes gene_type:complete